MEKRTVWLPPRYDVDFALEGNSVRQLRETETQREFEIVPYLRGRLQGEKLTAGGLSVITLPQRAKFDQVPVTPTLLTKDGIAPSSHETNAKWVLDSTFVSKFDRGRMKAQCEAVRTSWEGQFTFIEEATFPDGTVQAGLRTPQSGGLHAAIAHWKMSEEPATIVMPTGTGKTETMLGVTLHQRPQRVLVIVPTDPLRSQIANKFLTLGLLKTFGICGPGARFPVVGVLRHGPSSAAQLRTFFECCNVVVSTMSLIGGFAEAQQKLCAEVCSHLFVDEAHHIRASTWERFRALFKDRRILQFTATPYRNDGLHVDGRVIFSYSLRRAQEEKYFTPIRLLPVYEFDLDIADEAIARAAVDQLKKDIAAGHDHILLARTSSTEEADRLQPIYDQLGGEFQPLVIHSKLSSSVRRDRLAAIHSRTSRIAVCVDMFGEGFDLPELKVAALHDTHKSLAVTLQFIGRFTRTKGTIGEATAVVNLSDQAADDSLAELYAEGSNWNQVLRKLSEDAVGQHDEKQQFLDEFSGDDIQIPPQNLTPAMSTVVYRTKCQKWTPHRLLSTVPEERLYVAPVINGRRHVAYFVTRDDAEVDWGLIHGLVNVANDLFVLHWDKARGLLFIHTSNNKAVHEHLAKAVCGDDVELVKGSDVFRVFSGLRRLLLQTVGLSHAVGRLIRFTMLVGADIHAGLGESGSRTKVKTNVFASGFHSAQMITVGCSRKGRIWSRKTSHGLLEWVEWCKEIGTKLADSSFSEDDILKNSIVPEEISERPKLMPLTIEWPREFYQRDDQAIDIVFNGTAIPFYSCGLDLVTYDINSDIIFKVFNATESSQYEIKYTQKGAEYRLVQGSEIEVAFGRRRRSLSEWFRNESPVVRFEQDAFTVDNQLCKPAQPQLSAYDSARIDAIKWDGIDIKKESQTAEKYADSIQYHMIQRLKAQDYDIIFDDDGTLESADIVALAVRNKALVIHFFHCKFSMEKKPGGRVEDLYAVCGQAQRTVQWRAHVDHLLRHLMQRDVDSVKNRGASRFEKGDRKALLSIQKKARALSLSCEVTIVQPGLSKAKVTSRQLELLGATQAYLLETYEMQLRVVASD